MKKVVLVPRVSTCIGKDTARLLVKKGYTVYGASHRLEKMSEFRESGDNLLKSQQ